MIRPHAMIAAIASAALACFACGGGAVAGHSGAHATPADGGAAGSQGATDFGNAPADGGRKAPTQSLASGAAADAGRIDAGAACASARAGTQFDPVYLAFAFDVSGSMGKGDEPWHDKTLKWDPVVAATRAFFEDPASGGLHASLTFFPEDGDESERCVLSAYTTPDVPMTELPSTTFGHAIDAIEPQSADDWRGGTPTAWVVRGSVAFIDDYRRDHPGRYVLVLVTDGYPQGCDDAEDQIETVAADVEDAHAGGIDTYVIGVANPPIDGAPDTVSNLEQLAAAGGTEHAFLIDTGEPARTTNAFSAAVAQIRSSSISCNLSLPEPPAGRTFDKQKVVLSYRSGTGTSSAFAYDPTCTKQDAWHYDDPAAPAEIVLCDASCASIQADSQAEIEVEFACEQTIEVE